MQLLSSQPYKGSRDFYPEDFKKRRWIFETCGEILKSYGYEEYDGPLLESFELYAAKSGQELVEQQLYSLKDRGERQLAIRPEMTPTLARMVAAKLEELPKPVRWFSVPNVWRYERPQRGRLREHWQLNIDVLGGENSWAEAEILEVAGAIFQKFGGQDFVRFRINHRGLMDSLYKEHLKLEDSLALQLSRTLDAREKMEASAFTAALEKLGLSHPQISKVEDFLSVDLKTLSARFPGPASDHLVQLFERLSALPFGRVYDFDPSIVRGLDYYTGVVFEAFDRSPENNRALFGGGRYDNLMSLFHKNKSLSGVGLGMGDVVLSDFLTVHKLWPDLSVKNRIFVACPEDSLYPEVTRLAGALRAKGFEALSSLGSGAFKAHLKQADRVQARWIVLWGESERAESKVLVKDLSDGSQEAVALAAAPEWFARKIQQP
jgi:histidyl-tRNA synthetase